MCVFFFGGVLIGEKREFEGRAQEGRMCANVWEREFILLYYLTFTLVSPCQLLSKAVTVTLVLIKLIVVEFFDKIEDNSAS